MSLETVDSDGGAHRDDDSSEVIKLNVGGTHFMTTRLTLSRSQVFQQMLEQSPPPQQRSNRGSNSTTPSRKEKYFVRLKKEFFVDRNPECFRDILEYCRTGKTPFLGVISTSDNPSSFHTSTSSTSLDRCESEYKQRTTERSTRPIPQSVYPLDAQYLTALRDEAMFFELEDLAAKISDRLTTLRIPSLDYHSWLDEDCPHGGFRKIVGTRIAFAVAKDNYCLPTMDFAAPLGYRWASQAEYLSEYHRASKFLQNNDEWIHYNVGGWQEYTWKFTLNFAFLFRDSFLCGRFVHAGMKLSDISHVALFSMHSELVECDEVKGITEGFAGIVLIADEIIESPPATVQMSDPRSMTNLAKHTAKPMPVELSRSGMYDRNSNGPPPDLARLGSRTTRAIAEQTIRHQYGDPGSNVNRAGAAGAAGDAASFLFMQSPQSNVMVDGFQHHQRGPIHPSQHHSTSLHHPSQGQHQHQNRYSGHGYQKGLGQYSNVHYFTG